MFKLRAFPFIFPYLGFQYILKYAHLQLVAALWNNGFICFWHCSGTWNMKLCIISKCLSWQEKTHWKTTMITWANLLLDRFSFTGVNSNEFTLHFYICAYCVMYSSNTSLPGRAGVVQIRLRFIQGKEICSADDRCEALALGWCYGTACLHIAAAGKTTL